MKGEVGQSIREALHAMEELVLTFEKHLGDREAAGASAEELDRLTKGLHAIRDSAGIYMSWARHFAKVLGEADEGYDREMEEFLDEGGGISDNPLLG